MTGPVRSVTNPRMASPADPRTDEELVRCCNSGTAAEATAAFEVLYRRHRDFVLRVALRFAGDRDAALDVLQETFTYLLRKFPPTGSGLTLSAKLTTLLYPVAKHRALDARRKSDRLAGEHELPELAADAASGPDATAEPADIDAVFAALPAVRREVLQLRFVDDLSLAEIAAALEIPLGTVKSRLHLAIKQLREDPLTREFFAP